MLISSNCSTNCLEAIGGQISAFYHLASLEAMGRPILASLPLGSIEINAGQITASQHLASLEAIGVPINASWPLASLELIGGAITVFNLSLRSRQLVNKPLLLDLSLRSR